MEQVRTFYENLNIHSMAQGLSELGQATEFELEFCKKAREEDQEYYMLMKNQTEQEKMTKDIGKKLYNWNWVTVYLFLYVIDDDFII